MIHTSWTNRGQSGLSLLESAEFDTRDSLLLEGEQIKDTANRTREGPSIIGVKRRKETRELHAAKQKGADLLAHEVQKKKVLITPSTFPWDPL